MKIGFIQTGAIGDIVIALPAAKWYVDRGCQIFWPIDSRFFDFFKKAAPYVDFLPVPTEIPSIDWHLGTPIKLLNDVGIKDYFILYSYIGSAGKRLQLGHPEILYQSLKFDEYKYAVCQVPFSEKWNLHIERDMDAEARVLEMISADKPYSIIHKAPAGIREDIEEFMLHKKAPRIVRVSNLTDSPFDWISAFQSAESLAMEDSLHANLVEQLNIPVDKYLFLRSGCRQTPVFKNGWVFK